MSIATVQTSSFQGITFGWEYGSPQIEKRDALDHYVGTVWFVDHASFLALYAVQRPVAVTPITPSGPVSVDWWGSDPAGDLVITTIETRRAILVEMKGVRWVGVYDPTPGATPPGIHQATVDFLILS